MHARYSGTCKTTGRRYEAGTVIRKTDTGWSIDDTTTDTATDAVAEATVRLGGGSGYGCEGWASGDVVRDHAEGCRGCVDVSCGQVVVVVTSSSAYYSEDGSCFGVGAERGYRFSALARPATAVEAGSLLAEEQAVRDRRDALAARQKAEQEFWALDREQVGVLPDGPHQHYWLTQPRHTGYEVGPVRWDAYVYPDGTVFAAYYDPDTFDRGVYRVTGDGAAAVSRQAAWKVIDIDGTVVVDLDTD